MGDSKIPPERDATRMSIEEELKGLKPGTFEYAQKYHEIMTRRKADETPQEKALREYYSGVDDDGLPCD
jgi:hypothetical protein